MCFHGSEIRVAYRIDLLVENEVVIEVKSIEKFERVHSAQVLTYLTLADRRVSLLINFNVKLLMRDGFKRFVYNFPD